MNRTTKNRIYKNTKKNHQRTIYNNNNDDDDEVVVMDEEEGVIVFDDAIVGHHRLTHNAKTNNNNPIVRKAPDRHHNGFHKSSNRGPVGSLHDLDDIMYDDSDRSGTCTDPIVLEDGRVMNVIDVNDHCYNPFTNVLVDDDDVKLLRMICPDPERLNEIAYLQESMDFECKVLTHEAKEEYDDDELSVDIDNDDDDDDNCHNNNTEKDGVVIDKENDNSGSDFGIFGLGERWARAARNSGGKNRKQNKKRRIGWKTRLQNSPASNLHKASAIRRGKEKGLLRYFADKDNRRHQLPHEQKQVDDDIERHHSIDSDNDNVVLTAIDNRKQQQVIVNHHYYEGKKHPRSQCSEGIWADKHKHHQNYVIEDDYPEERSVSKSLKRIEEEGTVDMKQYTTNKVSKGSVHKKNTEDDDDDDDDDGHEIVGFFQQRASRKLRQRTLIVVIIVSFALGILVTLIVNPSSSKTNTSSSSSDGSSNSTKNNSASSLIPSNSTLSPEQQTSKGMKKKTFLNQNTKPQQAVDGVIDSSNSTNNHNNSSIVNASISSDSFSMNITNIPSSSTLLSSFKPMYINAGAEVNYTDSNHKVWIPDDPFVRTGGVSRTCWKNTTDHLTYFNLSSVEKDAFHILCTSRWFDFERDDELTPFIKPLGNTHIGQYEIPLPIDGTYKVDLHFAEVNPNVQIGERVFDILLEGSILRRGLDIVYESTTTKTKSTTTSSSVHVQAPSFIAASVRLVGIATVTDGMLSLGFNPNKGEPIISAIEIHPAIDQGQFPFESYSTASSSTTTP